MNFNQEISEGDLKIVDRLIEFIKVASNGIVKPYSHDHYLKSIKHLSSGDAEGCCPPSTEVREGKELKPYIIAAANKIKDILTLEVNE